MMVSRPYESSRAAKRQRRGLGRDSRSAELDNSSNPGNRRRAQPRSSAVARATEAALESCGFHPRAFAVAVLHDNGQVTVDASKNIDRFKHHLFQEDVWQQLRQASERDALPLPVDDQGSHVHDEPASPSFSVGTPFFDESEVSHASSPARNRYYLPRREPRPRKDKSPSPVNSSRSSLSRSNSSCPKTRTAVESQGEETCRAQGQNQSGAFSFPISDDKAVREAYEKRLRQIQQLAVKKMLKAWIKVAEPKKQTNYPYISSKEGQNREPKVPPWWPIDQVIHKEPDHINKEARIHLAIVMLRFRDRGPGWIAKLEKSTKNADLGNIEGAKAEERLARRAKLIQSLYDIAKMEEEYFLEDIDGDTMCTIYDFPPIKYTPKKRVPPKTARNKQSNKKKPPSSSTPSLPTPSSVQSAHQLASPTLRLGLENVALPVPRYNPSLGEPLDNSVSSSEAPRYSHHDGMLTGMTFTMDIQENNPQHRYSNQQHDTGPQRFADSQMQLHESYEYDAKSNHGLFEDPSSTYVSLRNRGYKPQASSTGYNNWHPTSAAEPFSPAPTSYAPTPTNSYQPPVSNFPGRMDFSFQAAGHTGPLASYQTPTPVTSPISIATSSTSQSFSQPSVHDLQERGPQPSLDTSQYSASTFRTTSLNNPHGLPFLMPGHQQF